MDDFKTKSIAKNQVITALMWLKQLTHPQSGSRHAKVHVDTVTDEETEAQWEGKTVHASNRPKRLCLQVWPEGPSVEYSPAHFSLVVAVHTQPNSQHPLPSITWFPSTYCLLKACSNPRRLSSPLPNSDS